MSKPSILHSQMYLWQRWFLLIAIILLPLFSLQNLAKAQAPDYHLIESNAAEVNISGTWTTQTVTGASGGSYLYNTGSDSDVLTLQFQGPYIEIIYAAGPSLGTLAVEIDGTVLRTVITTADRTTYQERSTISYLTDEIHMLRVYSQAGGIIAVDAFVVVGNQSPSTTSDTTIGGTRFPCNQSSPIQKISVREDGAAATQTSQRPSISADGRYVAFESIDPLVAADTNQNSDIYVADLQTCSMQLVSVSSTGTLANDSSYNAVISGNGRFVAFESYATTLVTPTTYTQSGIYIRDLQAGQTTRVSVSSTGAEANSSAYRPRISDDGRYVLFRSYASNLGGSYEFYIRDRQTSQTTSIPISLSYLGFNVQGFDLSGDGHRVFASLNNGLAVYDWQTTQSWQLAPANNNSAAGGLSSDGNYVTFVADGPNFPEDTQSNIYLVNLTTNERTFVASTEDTSVVSTYPLTGNQSVSSDGRFVLFETPARNILSDGDYADLTDLFLFDRQTSQNRRLSINALGEMANDHSTAGVLSDNGQFVALTSRASNYTNEPNTTISNIYVINLALLYHPFELATQTLSENAIQLTWSDTAIGETGWVIEESTNGITGWTVVGNTLADVTQFARSSLSCAVRRYYRVRATWSDTNRNDGFSIVARGITAPCTVCDNSGYIYRVSVASGNVEADGLIAENGHYWWETSVAVSADGRYTAFSSASQSFITNDTNEVSDIFVHDNVTCQTTRVSINSNGNQANGYARLPDISANGRYIVFESIADTLVAGDTNNTQDVFLHDRATGSTTRISLMPNGQQFTTGSGEGVISSDGRYVAFNSDTLSYGSGQIYVWDSQTQQTRLISASPSGVAGDRRSSIPRFSPDGHYLAFLSDSENLLLPDTPYSIDLYLADLQTGSLERVINAELDPYYLEWWTASDYQLSADGRYVVYTYAWTPSVPNALEPPNAGPVYVLDRQTNQTTLVSVSSLGTEGTGSFVDISGDGRYVTFTSSSILSTSDTDTSYDLYLHDRQTGLTTLVSQNANGQKGNSISIRPRISADRQVLAFVSYANNLISEDMNGTWDAFVVNIPQISYPIELAVTPQSQTTMNITWNAPYSNEIAYHIERSSDGINGWAEVGTVPASSTTYSDGSLLCNTRYYYRVRAEFEGGYSSYSPIANARTNTCLVSCDSNAAIHRISIGSDGQQGNRSSSWVNVSADGRYIVFQSDASNLVPNDSNNTTDIFVHDRVTCETTRVSLASTDEQANGPSDTPNISGDGRYVVYTSYATNLVAGDTNGYADVYLYDRQTRQVIQINAATNSQDSSYGGDSGWISADGRYVVFDTQSNTLVSPPETNFVRDVFVRELATGEIRMASRSLSGVSNADPSSVGTISGDGRYVVFISSSTSLVAGDITRNNEVFMRDMQTNTTRRISMSTSGGETNGSANSAKITTDGRYVVYTSSATNIVPNDTNNSIDVFLYDVLNNTTTLVSLADNEEQAIGDANNTWISDDGRLVAFGSYARNLVANDTTPLHYRGFYVRDLWTGHTVRISQGSTGLPTSDDVFDTALSRDGRIAAFVSYDATLVPTDQNAVSDIFVVNLAAYFTYLPAPTGLALTDSRLTSQTLTWIDSTPDETSYRLERSTNSFTGWAEIASLPADSTTTDSSGLACGTTYYYRLRAYFAGSSLYSAYSEVVNGTTVACPVGPTDVAVVNNGRTRQTITWMDSTGDETGYRVERSTNGSSGWVEIGSLVANSTTYNSTGLSCGTPYYYRVRAYYGALGIYSSYSATVNNSTPPCPDGPPDLTITVSTRTRHTLTWTDRDADATNYYVERSLTGTGSWSQIGTVGDNQNSYTVANLSCNTVYYFRVRGYYSADNLYSGYSSVISGTTLACPTAPTGLTITNNLVTQQTLVWNDTTTDETAFYIERSLTGTGSWVQQGSVGADTTTFDSTGLNCATRYYYRLRAFFGDSLYSPYSSIADATTLGGCPAAPSLYSMGFHSPFIISINWSDNATNETSYHIERAQSSSGPYIEIGSREANTTSYTDNGLECNTQYYYRVRAYNAIANVYSTYSNVMNGTTWSCLILPTYVSGSSNAPDRINLTWTDNSVRETAYLIERAPTSTGSWALIATLPVDSISYTNTGLTCGTPYYYRLRTYDERTNTYSSYSTITSASTIPCPNPPGNFRVTSRTLTTITLGWTDSSNYEQGYSVEVTVRGTTNWQVLNLTAANAITYRVTGLQCNTMYDFRARVGFVSSVFGPYSGIISETTDACPVAPSNIAFTFASPTQIRIAWQENATNESSYVVERSLNTTGDWQVAGTWGPNTFSIIDSWRSCNTHYYYRVRAYFAEDALYSSYSNVVTTLTSPCPPSTLAIFYNSTNQASLLQSLTTTPAASDYLHFDLGFTYGTGGQMVMGDWDGDGVDTVGVYRNGAFFFTSDTGTATHWDGIWFGLGSQPVVGRFDATVNHDCLGVTDAGTWSNGDTYFALYFTCNLTSGPTPPLTFQWLSILLPDSGGFTGTHQFVAGDFDGDGIDSIAVRRGNFIAWTNVPPTTLLSAFSYAQYIGAPGIGDEGRVVAGDWDLNHIDSFGLVYQNGTFYRRNDLTWSSGAYILQQFTPQIGTPFTVVSWRLR
ncbi:MAG: fibronectin type III domain-containing protein [Chloroflexi bacterium]|nr:fibronectin type III domain-containing protein [Chloroflexota bacterium]